MVVKGYIPRIPPQNLTHFFGPLASDDADLLKELLQLIFPSAKHHPKARCPYVGVKLKPLST